MKTKDIAKVINKRITYLGSIVVILFLIVGINLFNITIVKNDYYTKKLSKLTEKIVYGESSPRGRIYDRNYKLLVDNIAVPVIYYKKVDDVTKNEEIELAYKVSTYINIDSSNLQLRNLKEFYFTKYNKEIEKRITSVEQEKYDNRQMTSTDFYNLKLEKITTEDLETLEEQDIKVAYIFYLMNIGYSYQEKIIKDEDVSDIEYAYIAEHKSELMGFDVKYSWERVYPYGETFKTILGNIGSIMAEDKNYYLARGYSLDEIVGISYLEKQYEDILRGNKDKYLIKNGIEDIIEKGNRGNDIVLTIDIDVQQAVEKILEQEVLKTKGEVNTNYYNHTFVVIQQPNTGEILAMSGKQAIYVDSKYKIYDYTPGIMTNPITVGSIVKGASMIVGYNNGIIDIGTKEVDECIKLYSIPQKCSSRTLGTINDITALAYSSNVYQFKIAMKLGGINYTYGTKERSNTEALNIYRKTFNEFGLGVKTGIDLPIESIGNIGNKNTTDLLLNFPIGQYDTYTTMQLSQYMTTIASNGKRFQPHLLKEVHVSSKNSDLGKLLYRIEPKVLNVVNTEEKYLKRVQEGFKATMDWGYGYNNMGNSPSPAGKTGTSESFLDMDKDGIVDTETITSTFAGYAPYNNPIISITVVSPNLINPNAGNDLMSYANSRISRLISNKFFEIYDKY